VKDVAAILLAAGQSRRMGAFKPLLPFGDSTVIEACINNLRGAVVNEIVVVWAIARMNYKSILMLTNCAGR